jgi:hypothetical protein
MAKRTVAPADARRIRDNLLAIVRRHYRSQADLARYWEFGHGTVRAWFHRTRPTPPSLVNLLDLARDPRHHLSLDWLLLSTGDPLYRPRLGGRLGVPPRLSDLQVANLPKAQLARVGLMWKEQHDKAMQQLARGALWRLNQERRRLLQRSAKKRRGRKSTRRRGRQ